MSHEWQSSHFRHHGSCKNIRCDFKWFQSFFRCLFSNSSRTPRPRRCSHFSPPLSAEQTYDFYTRDLRLSKSSKEISNRAQISRVVKFHNVSSCLLETTLSKKGEEARFERVNCKTDGSSHGRRIVVWRIENVYFVFKFIAQILIEIGIVFRLLVVFGLFGNISFPMWTLLCGVLCWLLLNWNKNKNETLKPQPNWWYTNLRFSVKALTPQNFNLIRDSNPKCV